MTNGTNALSLIPSLIYGPQWAMDLNILIPNAHSHIVLHVIMPNKCWLDENETDFLFSLMYLLLVY